jgi:hypothetical protein
MSSVAVPRVVSIDKKTPFVMDKKLVIREGDEDTLWAKTNILPEIQINPLVDDALNEKHDNSSRVLSTRIFMSCVCTDKISDRKTSTLRFTTTTTNEKLTSVAFTASRVYAHLDPGLTYRIGSGPVMPIALPEEGGFDVVLLSKDGIKTFDITVVNETNLEKWSFQFE